MRGWCSWLWYPVYKVSCLMGGNELEITFRLQNVDKTKQSRSTQCKAENIPPRKSYK